MVTTAIWIYAIGFLAQAFFSARMLLQWILSEKAHRVVSPNIYWICSLVGSILLFAYGWLRNDFAIILGQMISYYIYIWNLNIKCVWQRVPRGLRIAIGALPAVAVVMMASDGAAFAASFLHNGDVPLPLLLWGSAGQVVFTLRFVYQWRYSHRHHESVLPLGFWIISLAGCAIIVSYGVFRHDPVLIIGQSVGFVTYSRNIALYNQQRKKQS